MTRIVSSYRLFLLLCAFACMFSLYPVADGLAEMVTPEPNPLLTADGSNCHDKYDGKFLAVIVPCITEEVKKTTIKMTEEFSRALKTPAYAFLTLVVAVFGVKIVMNEGDPKKDTFILLIKIAFAVFFMNTLGGFIPAVYGTLEEGVRITSSAMDTGHIQCDDVEGIKPWSYIDCIVGKIFGFAAGVHVGASIIGLLGSAAWSGQFGTVFFIAATMTLFFLMKLVIRTTYTYLMCAVVLGFMLFLSPLLIPLIWMPATQQYFDRWLNIVVATVVLPAIIMAFATLSFIIVDKVAFDKDVGVLTHLAPDEVEEMREARASANASRLSSNSPLANRAVGQTFTARDAEARSEYEPMTPFLSGSSDPNALNRLYTMDFRSDEVGKVGQFTFGFMALLLVSYVLLAVMDQILKLSQIMLGGGYFLDSAITDNPFENALTRTYEATNSSFAAAGARGLGAGMQQLARAPLAMINGLNPNSRR